MGFQKKLYLNRDKNSNCNDEKFEDALDLSKAKKKNTYLVTLKEVYRDYCLKTSIHGVQYFGETRPIKEKVFWIIVFILSIFCCSILIKNIYDKWIETPVIVSFSEKSTPVWSIPFPAVTICSETKRPLNNNGTTYSKIFNEMIESVKENKSYIPSNVTEMELEEFRTLLQVCNIQVLDVPFQNVSSKQIHFEDVLDRMMPSFDRYFFYCRWFNKFSNCMELFVKTYTPEGICFTFNGLNTTDLFRPDVYQYNKVSYVPNSEAFKLNRTLQWSLEKGYWEKSSFQTYPVRVLSAGARAGLFIILQSFKQEVDYACRGPVQGFKVLLHSPDDIPNVSTQFVRIPMDREILIAVKPNMITTSNGIAGYHPQRRQCFLNSERYLRFFKTYTQTNCELECLTNYTYQKCGCVKFSMPRSLDMAVCHEDKIYCYDRAEDELLLSQFRERMMEKGSNDDNACNCLPACTSLVYNVEISQGSFDLQEMTAASDQSDFFQVYPGSQMSRLSIYFKENQFITSKRSELYGITDFLANCGGIFGLFMGFSFLSVVEIIYHSTLRLWSNIKKNIIKTF